jgi:hypothetical protein
MIYASNRLTLEHDGVYAAFGLRTQPVTQRIQAGKLTTDSRHCYTIYTKYDIF